MIPTNLSQHRNYCVRTPESDSFHTNDTQGQVSQLVGHATKRFKPQYLKEDSRNKTSKRLLYPLYKMSLIVGDPFNKTQAH